MPIHKEISKLTAEFRPIVTRIIDIAKENHINLVINETLRDNDIQQAYYAQGRFNLDKVNELRAKAGLYLLSERENENIITNVMNVSQTKGHGAGLAVDFVPNGNWNSRQADWNIIGEAVEQVNAEFKPYLDKCNCEIVWGGNWKKLKDSPHVEMVKK